MSLSLELRSRRETPGGTWELVHERRELPGSAAALLLCDVWDRHWCRSAERRCDALARTVAQVVEEGRSLGVFIIHAPSECMEAYAGTPQRQRAIEAPSVEPPAPRSIEEPPLPIDDSDGGCDDEPQCPLDYPWTRQHAAIRIAPEDAVTDREEVFNLLRERGIETLFIAGVHTNMCVMKRSFGIRQMTRWGVSCVLIRDLTDTMYNPRMHPFVPHDEGTGLVIEHIERYLCPSIASDQLRAVSPSL